MCSARSSFKASFTCSPRTLAGHGNTCIFNRPRRIPFGVWQAAFCLGTAPKQSPPQSSRHTRRSCRGHPGASNACMQCGRWSFCAQAPQRLRNMHYHFSGLQLVQELAAQCLCRDRHCRWSTVYVQYSASARSMRFVQRAVTVCRSGVAPSLSTTSRDVAFADICKALRSRPTLLGLTAYDACRVQATGSRAGQGRLPPTHDTLTELGGTGVCLLVAPTSERHGRRVKTIINNWGPLTVLRYDWTQFQTCPLLPGEVRAHAAISSSSLAFLKRSLLCGIHNQSDVVGPW
jgi:hypothetical protein